MNLSHLIKSIAVLVIAFASGIATALADPWSFGVIADSQWSAPDDHKNPNSVAADIIQQIDREFIGDRAQFMTDGMKVLVQSYEDRPISVQIPLQVVLTVAEADAVMRGGTAAPSYKTAVLENGLKVQVPPFVNAGTKIVVSTEDGTYVKRAEN